MKFDPTEPVQTRDGRKARIIATDRAFPGHPIVALVSGEDGTETVRTYTAEGKFWPPTPAPCSDDLVNVPERTEWFMNLYPLHGSGHHGSRKQADKCAGAPHLRIGVIKFTLEGGRPVSAEVLPA